MVLRTIMSCLRNLDYDIETVCMETNENEVHDNFRADHLLKLPSFFEVLINVFSMTAFLRYSFNESLFYSKGNLNKIQTINDSFQADIVITDMVRMVPYIEKLEGNFTWIADLDDLLSKRYLDLLESNFTNAHTTLGFINSKTNKLFKIFFGLLYRNILTLESSLLTSREVNIARSADATLLVSELEANILSEASKTRIANMPMAISIPENKHVENDSTTTTQTNLVFVGGLNYGPNREALLYFQEKISPTLVNIGHPKLFVLGQADPIEASSSQLQQFRSRMGANARPLQKHHWRNVMRVSGR